MTSAIEIMARLLHPDDREVVLGDLAEQKQSGWSGFWAVLGFVIRQQAEYWRSWHSWIVGGAVIPATLLLLGASFRFSLDIRDLWQGGDLRAPLIYQTALLIIWAWTSGFAIGTLSRRTGWMSPLLFTIPCFSCLTSFREPSLSCLCLLLFLPPALIGAILGRRWMRMDFAQAVMVALAATGAMLLWPGMPVLYWLLLLPAGYLTWTSEWPAGLRRET